MKTTNRDLARPVICVAALLLVIPLFIACDKSDNPSDGSSTQAAADSSRSTTDSSTGSRGFFTNSLGMKFVPVEGTDVLFSIWETRVQDYAAYAQENPGVDSKWQDYECEGHKQEPDHPVVMVSWEDAKAFCAWLSKKEGKSYRLPTDHEWSVAVGIGDSEDANAGPKDKSDKIERVYPWGSAWPPPTGAGNYSDSATNKAFDVTAIDGYNDSNAFTSAAGSFQANEKGLYDLGGNVWEWCEDLYLKEHQYRVFRGGSWGGNTEISLRSSRRGTDLPTGRVDSYGFRVVVAPGVGG